MSWTRKLRALAIGDRGGTDRRDPLRMLPIVESALPEASPWMRGLICTLSNKSATDERPAAELTMLLHALDRARIEPFVAGGSARAMVLSSVSSRLDLEFGDVDVFVGPDFASSPDGWSELPDLSSYPRAIRVWNSPSCSVQLVQTSDSDPARVVEQFDFANVMAWIPLRGELRYTESFARAEAAGLLDGAVSALRDRPERFLKRALKWAVRTGHAFSATCVDEAFDAVLKNPWTTKDVAGLSAPLFPLSMSIEIAARAGHRDPTACALVRACLAQKRSCNDLSAVLRSFHGR